MTSSSSCEPHSGSSGGPSESSDDSASSPRGALRRPDGAPSASSSRSSSSASPFLLRRFSRSSSRSSDSCRAVVCARSSARVSCDGVWTVEGGQTARARRGRGRLGRHEIDVVVNSVGTGGSGCGRTLRAGPWESLSPCEPDTDRLRSSPPTGGKVLSKPRSSSGRGIGRTSHRD